MTASSIGGIASKLGNGYEAKWLVRQLLDVAHGRVRSLRFEGITARFAGFEAAIQKENVTEWHQTKINAPRGNWTVAALEREGVLSAFARRLAASASDRCVFVSQDPVCDVRAMSEKASRANDVGEFIGSLSKKEREAYASLKAVCAGLNAERAIDDTTMQLWLSRCSFLTMPVSEIDSYIETIGSLLLDGNQIFGALRVYLEERFNKLLTTELVRQDLQHNGGATLKHWQLDPTLTERIKAENDGYLAGHGVPGSRKNPVLCSRLHQQNIVPLQVLVYDGPAWKRRLSWRRRMLPAHCGRNVRRYLAGSSAWRRNCVSGGRILSMWTPRCGCLRPARA